LKPTTRPQFEKNLTCDELEAILLEKCIYISRGHLETIFGEIDNKGMGYVNRGQFEGWVNSYRQRSGWEKTKYVYHTQITGLGFWQLVLAFVGVLLFLGPDHMWERTHRDGQTYQVARFFLLFGAMKNAVQAISTSAAAVDVGEQAKLDLKRSFEQASDRFKLKEARIAKQKQLSVGEDDPVRTKVRRFGDLIRKSDALKVRRNSNGLVLQDSAFVFET
jgi:hypothetical protein